MKKIIQSITPYRLAVITGVTLILGGITLSLLNYQNIFAATIVIAAFICLWFSQDHPRPKLFTIGFSASVIGILFAACINLIPIFKHLRNANPTSLSVINPIGFFSGAMIFLVMIIVLMSGFIFTGIAILRSAHLPKASGWFFILGGIVAFAANVAGILIALAGLAWLITVYRQKRLSEWTEYLESLDK